MQTVLLTEEAIREFRDRIASRHTIAMAKSEAAGARRIRDSVAGEFPTDEEAMNACVDAIPGVSREYRRHLRATGRRLLEFFAAKTGVV